MGITVRTGNAADMQVALPLMLERLRERSEIDRAFYGLRPDAARLFRQWIGPVMEDPRHALFVAEHDGQMIGCLAAIVERDLPIFEVDEYAVVRLLWVAPDERGRGVATKLLERAAREYAAMGVRQIRATAAAGRDVEYRVAEKAGFRPAGVTFLRELDSRKPPWNKE